MIKLSLKQKRKRSILHPMRTTQTRKGQCPARRRQNKEEKNQYDRGMEMGGQRKAYDEKRMYFRGRGNCRS